MQLRSSDLAAPAARCLPLLPSGSGGVHRATMRETRSSTPHEPSGAQVIGGLSQPKLLASLFTSPGGPQPGRHAPRGGGEAGIRTRGGVSPTHALQACSFNHSDTSPDASRRPLLPRMPAGQPLSTLACYGRWSGGEGGIRTHVGVAPQPAFEAGPLRPLRYLSVFPGTVAANPSAPLRSV